MGVKLTLSAVTAGVILLALYAVLHPLGAAFAIGVYPVPQGTGWPYQLESGFIPALTVLSLLGTLISLYHLRNCHWQGCWKLGKHQVNGSPWCSVHHSQVKPERSVHDLLTSIELLLTAAARNEAGR